MADLENAREFLKTKINEFYTKELCFYVVNTKGWRVAYTNVDDPKYVETHAAYLQTEEHQTAINRIIEFFAPTWNDEIAWHLSLHEKHRMLVLKHQDEVEVIFLSIDCLLYTSDAADE